VPFASNRGVKLHYLQRGGRGETVVLIPGLGLRAGAWGAVADFLSDSHHVIIAEPRGSGESDAPDEPYTADVVASDLEAILDAANVGAPHIVGLSMGGMIAQDFALRRPSRVGSLVLLSTFASPDWWFRRLFEFRRDLIHTVGIEEHYRIFLMVLLSPLAFRKIPDQIEAIEASILANPPPTAGYLRQIDYCLQHDVRPELAKLRVPTLVIAGSHDFLTTAPLAAELAAAIPGARYHELRDASHGLWLEYPEELVTLCREFFASLDASDGRERQ
jgi:3-oxoadipate enol-lactonase